MSETFVFIDDEKIYYLLYLDNKGSIFINTFKFGNDNGINDLKLLLKT